MNKILITSFALFLSAGCASKGIIENFKQSNYNEKMINNYQKKSIISELETKVVISTVYMNKVEDINASNDRFLISLYIQNDFYEKKRAGMFNKHLNITLKDQNGTHIEEVDDEHPFFPKLPLYTKWSRYYLVDFNATTPKILNIQYLDYQKISIQY